MSSNASSLVKVNKFEDEETLRELSNIVMDLAMDSENDGHEAVVEFATKQG